MAPPKIKLTYFAGRGRGELPRLILATAGVPYENIRIPMEEWPSRKSDPAFPFAALPVLEYDGFILAQTMTIGRYLARKFGLAGDTEEEQAKADMIVDLFAHDYFEALLRAISAGENEKDEKIKKCFEEDVPGIFAKAERVLKEAGGEYFVGNKLTWADIVAFDCLNHLTEAGSPLFTKRYTGFTDYRLKALNGFPVLTKHYERVKANPAISKWLKERPGDDEEPL